MIFQIIKNFFKGLADPILEWPVVSIITPEFDTAQKKLGTLAFGDKLEKAVILGRPTARRYTGKNYVQLLYANSGFQVDFNNGCLAYAAFFSKS